MVRVLGATGRMYNVAAVVPMVEQRISFNGRTERKLEVARSLDVNPNGLLFLKSGDDIGNCNIFEADVIEYIGNIPTEDVREILSFMLVDGFYNFSDWEYQKEKDMKDIKLDNGLSNPYSSAITKTLDFGIIRNPIGKNRYAEDWTLFGDLDSEYGDSISCFTGDLSNSKQNIYDQEWNTEAFLEDDYYEDTEEDGWADWDAEE